MIVLAEQWRTDDKWLSVMRWDAITQWTTNSRVEIGSNPKKIARKGFSTVSGTVSGGE